MSAGSRAPHGNRSGSARAGSAAGQTRERRSAYSGTRRWPVGRPVPVRYQPDAPQTAVIDTRAQKTAVIGVMVLVGTTFTAIPLLLLTHVV
ncbi:DUF3592 domain-containing protein [Kitasatospora sp. NPDC048296]|uniref:DUF3592 domain-containing protein n=1 Tax=Kitasatospora sp. NPDC048296 TaxID=3364048 RepID=UPI003711DBC5